MKTNQTKPVCRCRFEVLLHRLAILAPRSSILLLVLLLSAGSAFAATRYVWQDSPSPGPPFTDWTTAAHVIQDAVDAADSGDTVLVAGGVYATGGRAVGTNQLVNRVAIDRAITVESLMGPEVTIIQGYQVPDDWGGIQGNGDGAIRCVYLADGASVSGFTLTNGATLHNGRPQDSSSSGGGAWCVSTNAVITNCILTGNSAGYGGGAYYGTLNNCTLTSNLAIEGGGVYEGTLNNCILSDNSAFIYGGGARYGTLNNCTVIGNSADNDGGGVSEGTLNNCTLSGNSASYYGGGADSSTLNNCTLTGNSALGDLYVSGRGGGAYYGELNHCVLTENSAGEGGGVYEGTLNNCTVSGNSAYWGGGGVNSGTLNNCTLTGNSAISGGGAEAVTLNNCTLTGNSAAGGGGGAYKGTLNNCTVSGNSAYYGGGGADYCTLNNCIVYYNSASTGPNYDIHSTFTYSCTTPLPPGPGNIDSEPLLASSSHLSAQSPCIGQGSSAYSSGVDIDGEAWANPPSIGCDEYHVGVVTGPLSVNIAATYTNVAVGFPVEFTALIDGRTRASAWDFGDSVVISNRPYATHAWTAPGDYAVVLRAYNETLPEGVSASVTVHVVTQSVYYVNASGSNPAAPFLCWATAATTIQDAVSLAVPGANVVVSNGVYSGGLNISVPLALLSVNGPQFTIIDGGGTNECVHRLGDGASLTGFTLTNGFTSDPSDYAGGVSCASSNAFLTNCVITGNTGGGGASGGTLYNCTLTGNSDELPGGGAWAATLYACTLNNCTLSGNSAGDDGGGAAYCTLNHCTLTGNSAGYSGGGASGSTLNNCTLSGNSALDGGGANDCWLYNCTLTGNSALGAYGRGGGAYICTLNNCIVYYNAAPTGPNYYSSTFNYSCTTPMPTSGAGNIHLDPLFVDTNGWSDLRLQPASPCIDAGTNLAGLFSTDLLGLPRPLDGDGDGLARFDIGAYEFNPYRFEPTLQMSERGFLFTVSGEPGRSVRIERSTDLVHWEYAGEVPIPMGGQTLIDPAATTEPRLFYRAVRVP